MKLIVIAVFTLGLLVSTASAEKIYTEEKVSDGYKVQTTTVDGTFKSKHQSKFPYVCYDRRVRTYVDGVVYLRYEGCNRFNSSCESLGRVHFGKYPNDYSSHKAYRRCVEANPKFVD
ncbi:MAG: hypothetical protein U9O24_08980 [Campylobacterota bacterium]|nr:hypothetical protein [Campylobacterota bacterium]